jgi:2-polyprenyl-3-methyl-5-hydroxy-6-metoxy-1,4-benzoquinol methylase
MDYKSKLYKYYSSTINNQNVKDIISLDFLKNKFDSFEFYYSDLLPSRYNVNILDIGCGEGIFVYYLQEKGYTRVYGVDISEEYIDNATNRIGNITDKEINDFNDEISKHKVNKTYIFSKKYIIKECDSLEEAKEYLNLELL